ncbi:MAG: hypothetical protein R3B09_07860 [Nannocystaceae bacterium]
MRLRPPTPLVWAALAAAAVVILDLSTLGLSGPWDPWETHYGEVARQILVRSDPIDLWWQPGWGPDGNAENTFWSKPALPFWLMALSMKLLGVGVGPAADEMVRSPLPELAIRLPSMIAGWLSAAFLGFVTWRLGHVPGDSPEVRRRAAHAGIFAALALSLMPQWAMVTRQALTDMFFVGPVILAMGAWALAWLQPDRRLRRRPLGPRFGRRLAAWTIPWDRAYLAFVGLFAVGVILPIVGLEAHVLSDATRERVATFVRRPDVPSVFTLWQIHMTMVFYLGLAAVTLLWSLRWRRRSQAWMGILYLAAGLSLLGKGMIGPGLIGLLVLADMAVHGRFRLLRRCGLGSGVVLFALASFPWHHAMAIYRGDRFINELIVINNLTRFDTGEQEQAVGGFTYYLRTLGIASLPWIAALPAAIWRALRAEPTIAAPSDEDDDDAATEAAAEASREIAHGAGGAGTGPQRAVAGPSSASLSASAIAHDPAMIVPPWAELRRFALLWLAVSLLLLTYSVTKYYHYLLPALPPMAALLGPWLAEAGGRDLAWLRTRVRPRWLAALIGVGVGALVIRDAIHTPAWIAHLTTYLYVGMWLKGAPEVHALAWLALPFAAGLGLWAAMRPRLAAAAMIASSYAIAAWLFVVYLPHASESWSQRSAIRTYFERRGPGDPLLSYWFYYRGETFFTKGDVWVTKEAKRERLVEIVDEKRGHAESLWLITTGDHAKRAVTMLPREVQGGVEWAYENSHYALLRIPLPPAAADDDDE